jgi:hypothetical protein
LALFDNVFKDYPHATVETSGVGHMVVCAAEAQEYFSVLTAFIFKMAASLLG